VFLYIKAYTVYHKLTTRHDASDNEVLARQLYCFTDIIYEVYEQLIKAVEAK